MAIHIGHFDHIDSIEESVQNLYSASFGPDVNSLTGISTESVLPITQATESTIINVTENVTNDITIINNSYYSIQVNTDFTSAIGAFIGGVSILVNDVVVSSSKQGGILGGNSSCGCFWDGSLSIGDVVKFVLSLDVLGDCKNTRVLLKRLKY